MAQSLGDGIRPMTLPAAPTGVGPNAGHLHPDMSSGGGGSGPPQLTSNIGIEQQEAGDYVAENPIPIGADVIVNAPPTGITSYSWEGADYAKSYLAGPATAAPPLSQAAPGTPVANTSQYIFVVGPTANENYSIEVNVTYEGGGKGTSYLSFTSIAPTGSLSVMKPLPNVVAAGMNGLSAEIIPAIQIQGTASLGAAPPGQFMFMQILTSVNQSYTDANNVGWFRANNQQFDNGSFNGPLIDAPLNPNGTGVVTASLFTYTNSQGQVVTNNTSWSLPDSSGNTKFPAGGNTGFYIKDAPDYIVSAQGALNMQVSESFADYLMYQPNIEGAVWIAISQIAWSWSANVTKGQAKSSNPIPAPQGPSTPSGLAAFPPWVSTTVAFALEDPQKK